jgi:hypothetical protein
MPIRVYALFAACVIACYWRVLTTFFGVDDFSYLHLTVFPFPGWAEAFALRYFADNVVFAWHRMLVGGLNPVWYHVTLVGLHLLNTGLVLTLLPKLGMRRRPDAAIAAFVFALHPTTYTVLNWVALGFEELPVITLTLVVVHLFVAHMKRPRIWLLAAAPVLMFIACGFKNLAIFLPAWLTAAGVIIIFDRDSSAMASPVIATARGPLVRRAVLFILPTIFVSAWYAIVVTPLLPQWRSAGYATDFSPSSVLHGFSLLMANLLNPFVVRIGTGYQGSVPAAIAQWGPMARGAFAAAIVSIVLAAWMMACLRTRRFLFGATMLGVIVVGIAPYTIVPGRWSDYMSWPLPACAALWGMTLAEAYRYARERTPRAVDLLTRRPVQAAAAVLLVSYMWVSGATLYGSNLFVRQAHHAELVDAVARRALDGARILFVPPSELAYTDTTYGQSITSLHREKRLRVEYVTATGTTDATGATSAVEMSAVKASADVVPLLLDTVPNEIGEAPRLYAVERAQWAANAHIRIERGRTLIQPFSTGAGRVREIHLLLDAFSDRCALRVDVVSAASTGTPMRVAGGVMPCRGRIVTGYRSVLLDQPLAPKSDYALHVTATPDDPPPDALRCAPLTGGGAWAPFHFNDEPAGSPHVLAMRLISERWR